MAWQVNYRVRVVWFVYTSGGEVRKLSRLYKTLQYSTRLPRLFSVFMMLLKGFRGEDRGVRGSGGWADWQIGGTGRFGAGGRLGWELTRSHTVSQLYPSSLPSQPDHPCLMHVHAVSHGSQCVLCCHTPAVCGLVGYLSNPLIPCPPI